MGRRSNDKKPSNHRATSGVAIPLEAKQQPLQRRSIDTVELILDVTARLLGDIGVERLSTNLICKAANITPPALYRYFPNKYAVLKTLGERLIGRRNQAYLIWLAKEKDTAYDGSREDMTRRLLEMQTAINAITLEFPGAAWIMRALRAVPALQQVRLDSHNAISEISYTALRDRYPHANEAELRLAMRMSIEMMYSASEMVVDNPAIASSLINAEVAEMVVRYYDKFVENEARHAAAARTQNAESGRAAGLSTNQPKTTRKPALKKTKRGH